MGKHQAVRVAYADPPYPKQARKHYRNDPSGIPAAEVDHAALIAELEANYDGWALSTGSASLKYVLSLCPDGVRVGSWVKTFSISKPGVYPTFAWEPVIYHAPKRRMPRIHTVKDWTACPVTVKRGTHGAKPDQFCYWLFAILKLQPGDNFIDLFPGSGAVTRAWQQWVRQARIWEQSQPPHTQVKLWTPA